MNSVYDPSNPVGIGGTGYSWKPYLVNDLTVQAGIVPPPTTEQTAAVTRPLDVPQEAASIGEKIPIVFCLQAAGAGGIMVSPKATEGRFENSLTNQVTAYYLLVVSEGQIGLIQVRDVFSGGCRHGSHTQTFNRRAGTWIPGNAIVPRATYDVPQCPQKCGSIGSYPNITTVSFQRQVPNGSTLWDRQVSLFIRGGMFVTRMADLSFGSSNNFADLAYWLLTNIGRINTGLIDTTNLTLTAQFLSNYNLTCDCMLKESINYETLIATWAPYFLVRPSRIGGKRGLVPLMPTEAGYIKTSASTAVYQFDESNILLESFQLDYRSLSERAPVVVQVQWRQQAEDDVGAVRTVEVRYTNTDPETISKEAHDLSEFCTRGQHAAMVGAYILASRVNVTHTVRFSARPQAHNLLVNLGDIIRVKLQRKTVGLGEAEHDYLYEVVGMTKSLEGVVAYECVHHPVNTSGQSIVALAVANATFTDPAVSTAKTGPSCDENVGRASDTTVPAETYIQTIDPPTPLTPTQAAAVEVATETLLGNIPQQGTATGVTVNTNDMLDDQG